jgi:hypothetical protein
MKDRDVKKATKIKIAETIILPTVPYGSESWTALKKGGKKSMLLSYGRGEEFCEFPGQRRERTFQFWKTWNPKDQLRYFGHVMRASHWKGTLCLGKLQDTGSRENHGCDGLTASNKLPAYDWKI